MQWQQSCADVVHRVEHTTQGVFSPNICCYKAASLITEI